MRSSKDAIFWQISVFPENTKGQKWFSPRYGSRHGEKAARINAILNENFLKPNLLSEILLKLFLSSNVYLAFIETNLQCFLDALASLRPVLCHSVTL